jgi:hypothetical protein
LRGANLRNFFPERRREAVGHGKRRVCRVTRRAHLRVHIYGEHPGFDAEAFCGLAKTAHQAVSPPGGRNQDSGFPTHVAQGCPKKQPAQNHFTKGKKSGSRESRERRSLKKKRVPRYFEWKRDVAFAVYRRPEGARRE